MNLSENVIKVLEKRYLIKDEKGNVIETPEEMFKRVADSVASAYKEEDGTEELAEKFYQAMTNLEFLPNSPTLMNAGRPMGQLSACFVLPVEDAMESIFDTIKNAALIHKSGGGTGFSFSRIRPKGATVASTGGVASGPVSFMKVFNAATEAVKQGGTRRGANMGILRVDHPDILEFIKCKEDNTEVTNFNISVGITADFMEAVGKDEEYDLINPRTKKTVGRLKAKKVFDMIVEMAWTNGEPGIIFLDRLNKDNPTPALGEIESTNPCGEQPLLPYESCNLASINLAKMVKKSGKKALVDYKKLEDTVRLVVHFLDNVIEANNYPLTLIEEMTKQTRKIGLGVMGFADLLISLGIPYDSEEGVKLGKEIMSFIDKKSKEESIELAKKRGTYPAYKNSKHKKSGLALRNATTTTIAPTGTISIIAGTSSGIEPVFAISYFRNVMDNDKLVEIHPLFEELAVREGFYSEELMEEIAKKGSLHEIEGIPSHIKRLFVTAHDIKPYWHIRMQAAFQEHVDNAVSKTVNFSHSATKEMVEEVYIKAYETGCKGVTIYRDGSRDAQVLNIGKADSDKTDADKTDSQEQKKGIIPRPRPKVTRGLTEKVKIGCGNLYITANYDDNGICEVMTNLGRAGGCPSQSEATSRLISIALRSGISVEAIIEQLKGIRCHSTLSQRAKGNKEINVLSCPDAIGRTLEKLNNGRLESSDPSIEEIELSLRVQSETTDLCPECGSPVEYEGGCKVCRSCGYSKCG